MNAHIHLHTHRISELDCILPVSSYLKVFTTINIPLRCHDKILINLRTHSLRIYFVDCSCNRSSLFGLKNISLPNSEMKSESYVCNQLKAALSFSHGQVRRPAIRVRFIYGHLYGCLCVDRRYSYTKK